MEALSAIAQDMRERFAREGTPAVVVEGAEPMTRGYVDGGRVVIYETKDTFGGVATPGVRGTPPSRSLGSLYAGYELLIYNRSNAPGATSQEHRYAARRLMRAVYRSLVLWARLARTDVTFSGGAFVGPADPTTTETFGLYQLQIVVGESILDAPYEVAEGGSVTPAGSSVLNGGTESGCHN